MRSIHILCCIVNLSCILWYIFGAKQVKVSIRTAVIAVNGVAFGVNAMCLILL